MGSNEGPSSLNDKKKMGMINGTAYVLANGQGIVVSKSGKISESTLEIKNTHNMRYIHLC